VQYIIVYTCLQEFQTICSNLTPEQVCSNISYCSLTHRRVHEIKRTYLASRIHGLFITWSQSFISTMHTRLHDIYGGACPNPFDNPLLLGNLYPYSLKLPSYLLGIPPLCRGANPHPLWSQVGCILAPPPFLPIPIFSSPTVLLVKRMPSYDDIAISASHSLIQLYIFFYITLCHLLLWKYLPWWLALPPFSPSDSPNRTI
jgi:hypothetical protein